MKTTPCLRPHTLGPKGSTYDVSLPATRKYNAVVERHRQIVADTGFVSADGLFDSAPAPGNLHQLVGSHHAALGLARDLLQLGVEPSILGPTNLTRVQSSSYTGGARIDIRGEQGRMGMVSIPIEAQVSPEQLLQAVEQLPPDEFSAFVAQLLDLQARRSRQSEEPVEVAHDQRMAQLAAEVRTSRQRVLGLHKGAVTISEDFDDPLPDDFWLGNE